MISDLVIARLSASAWSGTAASWSALTWQLDHAGARTSRAVSTICPLVAGGVLICLFSLERIVLRWPAIDIDEDIDLEDGAAKCRPCRKA